MIPMSHVIMICFQFMIWDFNHLFFRLSSSSSPRNTKKLEILLWQKVLIKELKVRGWFVLKSQNWKGSLVLKIIQVSFLELTFLFLLFYRTRKSIKSASCKEKKEKELASRLAHGSWGMVELTVWTWTRSGTLIVERISNFYMLFRNKLFRKPNKRFKLRITNSWPRIKI